MKIFKILVLFLIFLFTFSKIALNAEVSRSEISDDRIKLFILSDTYYSTDQYYSITQEVTAEAVTEAFDLGRFDILDDFSLNKDDLKLIMLKVDGGDISPLIKLGQQKAVDEALVISVINFSQRYVVEEKDEDEEDQGCVGGCIGMMISSFFELIITGDIKGSEYYETKILIKITKINMETEKIDGVKALSAKDTGSTEETSKNNTINELKEELIHTLRDIFPLKSEISLVRNDEVKLEVNSDIDVKEGIVFEISKPVVKINKRNERRIVPGQRAGFVTYTESKADGATNSTIIRQSHPFKKGYLALENIKSKNALQIDYTIPISGDYTNWGVSYHANTLKTFDYGFGLKFVRITDSYNDKDNGFTINGLTLIRLLNFPHLDFGLKVDAELSFVFRKDDENKSVSMPVFSFPIAVCSEVVLMRKLDLVLDAGYRIGGKKNEWQTSDGKVSGGWLKTRPEIDLSGFYFSIGLRFLLY